MRQRLFRWLFAASLLGILGMGTLFFSFFFHTWHQEQGEALRQEATLLATLSKVDPLSEAQLLALKEKVGSRVRVTVIAADGTVLADSDEKPEMMENHKNRPEVKEALLHGIGEEERNSTTLRERNYYCAVRSDNGHVVRVSYVGNSVYAYIWKVLPLVFLFIVLSLIFSYALAKYVTSQFMTPLEQTIRKWGRGESLSIDGTTYAELGPVCDLLEKQRNELARVQALASSRRREFSSNVSHELKSPLTIVSGYAEMIAQGLVTKKKEVQSLGQHIYDGAQRMLGIIDSLLHLSEIEQGEDTTPWTTVELAALVTRCIRDCQETWLRNGDLGQENSVEVQWTEPADAGAYTIQGNAVLLEEVVRNLIDNAYKYGNQEPIQVSLVTESDGYVLRVQDQGCGIPADKLDRIFERFYRVDESRTQQDVGGTGIGLALVKHIVSMHGGSISIASEEGKGTLISVWFPFS